MIFYLILGIYLLVLALVDMFSKKLPVFLLVIGVLPTVISFLPDYAYDLTVIDRVSGLLSGLVVIAVAKLSKEKIGIGDGIVLCITGLSLGFRNNYTIAAMAFFLISVYSLAMIAGRRLRKGDRIAFVPFVMMSFVIFILMQEGV